MHNLYYIMHEYWFRGDRNLSVSSHLTPDPEKRLIRMLENLNEQQRSADFRLFAGAIVSAVEMFALTPSCTGAEILLCAAILIVFTAMSPLMETEKRIKFLDVKESELPDDYIFDGYDIAKYSRSELVNFLDKYLGGGISATPYYEDMVSRISYSSRRLVRRQRLLLAMCIVIALAQVTACISFLF